MNIVSINVGRPREVQWRGQPVMTSIFKDPVAERVGVKRLNIDGDAQADLSVHGGKDKAVYGYPAEHYAFWRDALPGATLSWGAFGENLTTTGLLERAVHIGDRWRIGSADFEVSQPRMPCFKLIIRFDRPDMAKRFLLSGRPGFYLRVLKEGAIAPGDEVTVTSYDAAAISIADIFNLYAGKLDDDDLLHRASELEALPENWRTYFRERLDAEKGN